MPPTCNRQTKNNASTNFLIKKITDLQNHVGFNTKPDLGGEFGENING